MTSADRTAILKFARSLRPHDLMFLRRDITQDSAIDDWLQELETGEIATVLALVGDEIVGYSSIQRSRLDWSAHVGELRVLIAESMRHKGLGKVLTADAFALALSLGVEKMMAQMTVDQKGAIAAFEGLGFRPEALLRDHVRDREGRKHDLLVLSHDVSRAGIEED
jgi:RimJ/RimL family protein N-acetyltransferase